MYIHSKDDLSSIFSKKDHVNMPFSISINILISKEAKNEKSLHQSQIEKYTRGVHSNFESNLNSSVISKKGLSISYFDKF